jgi:hypothetical protein
MTWEQLVSEGLAVGFALAFGTGLAHKLIKGVSARFLRTPRSAEEHMRYVEVWECPRCRQLNRIPHSCKNCGARLPITPRFKTVPEQLLDQLQPAAQPQRRPPGRRT